MKWALPSLVLREAWLGVIIIYMAQKPSIPKGTC